MTGNSNMNSMNLILCFAIVFGIAFLVLRCSKPKWVYEKDSKGKEKLNSWRLVGYSALVAVAACLLCCLVNKAPSNNSPIRTSPARGTVNPYASP